MATKTVDIGTLITETPGVQGGQPCIAGTRIRVAIIAGYWHQGYTAEEIATTVFEFLDLKQVYAALAYYHANREQIDARIAADREFSQRLAAGEVDLLD